MVTKTVKQPNGKYMSVQTTADMLSWNMDRATDVNYDNWDDFCESVEANQGFSKEILEKLIEDLPEEGIAEMTNMDYNEHFQYMHHDGGYLPCVECTYYQKREAILWPEEET